jgi:Xaa-Pro aminopeptidase
MTRTDQAVTTTAKVVEAFAEAAMSGMSTHQAAEAVVAQMVAQGVRRQVAETFMVNVVAEVMGAVMCGVPFAQAVAEATPTR